jgi:hypothetical protein
VDNPAELLHPLSYIDWGALTEPWAPWADPSLADPARYGWRIVPGAGGSAGPYSSAGSGGCTTACAPKPPPCEVSPASCHIHQPSGTLAHGLVDASPVKQAKTYQQACKTGPCPVNATHGNTSHTAGVNPVATSSSTTGGTGQPQTAGSDNMQGGGGGNPPTTNGACEPENGGSAAEAVRAKVADMKAAMTDDELGRTTYAAAHVTTWLGMEEMWVAGAGDTGYARPAIRGDAFNMKSPAPSYLSDLVHINDGEMHLYRAAYAQGATINALGATRPVCPSCQERLPSNIPIVTELGC